MQLTEDYAMIRRNRNTTFASKLLLRTVECGDEELNEGWS